MPLDFTKDVLFVGHGCTAPCWYRVVLPAMTLGADYVGVVGEPPDTHYVTGIVQGRSAMPMFSDYRVVILQQAYGKGWLDIIKTLQRRGIAVVYECDDWLHAIKNQADHDFREDFGNAALSEFEMCMKACDAMIVSTEFLANIYRAFNRQIYVCENGVDVKRYDLKMPVRDTVNIGWAGATGHRLALVPWLQAVAKVMRANQNTVFVSIGQDYATAFLEQFPQRAIAVPFCAIEQYPAAMTMMDIAIAPAAPTGFYRGKSDLRWLEAGALGIPTVAHPLVYPKLKHGQDGFHASTPAEVKTFVDRLVCDPNLRLVLGENARSYVRRERSAEAVAERWREVIEKISSERRKGSPGQGLRYAHG
jgi:glycosyltransferase involved in cell wall biosynthesis